MTPKRLILGLMTFAMLFLVGADLVSSWGKPQFASRLGLYEVDLKLQSAEWQGQNAPPIQSALGAGNPQQEALVAYQKVRDRAGKTFAEELSEMSALRTQAMAPEPDAAAIAAVNDQIDQLSRKIDQQQLAIDEVDLRIGILQALGQQIDAAQATWAPMLAKDNAIGKTARSLSQIWGQSPRSGDVASLQKGLDGWFRDAALKQQYQVAQQPEQLAALQVAQQAAAQSAVVKLGITGAISIVSLLTGIGLGIWLIVQRLWKGSESVLAGVNGQTWDVKWDWEIVWQVLVVGFFFIGQVLLPTLLGGLQGALGFTAATLSERGRALWILFGYLGLAGGGIAVLYGSIQPSLPLAENWFKVDPKSPWLKWGLGGYFVAFPIVVGVSLVNQQIWQGQGGSNPILSIAAQNQDPAALVLIFITAAIAAPFFEETLFRGFLLPSLTRYMPTWGAIGLSSLIFALVHLSLSEVLPLTALAIVLGFVYTKTQNLLASMLLHSLWNSGTLIALFLLGGAG